MKKAESVDEFIDTAPQEVRSRLQQLRAAIKKIVPQAQERISYAIPFYEYKGRLVYFAYAKHHIGVYGIMEPVRKLFKKELGGYEMSKGTIRFPLDEKLPLALFKKLVKAQIKHNELKFNKK